MPNIQQLEETSVFLNHHRVEFMNSISTVAWQKLNSAEQHINKQIRECLSEDK